MNRRPLLLLLTLTLLGAALRLWGLGEVPPGLHPDEAANAYEAYCLRTTGAASDGRVLPWVFCMHGRFWVEGSYVWLLALVQGLPLSLPVSTRLPAALAGVALIPATWALARRLVAPRAAWVAAGLVAIEPLAVHTSRVGLRASLVPPALACGLALLLGPAARRHAALARGAVAGALAAFALWTYTPQRVWVPLLGVACVGAFWRRVRPQPTRWVLAGGLTLLALSLSLPWTVAGDGRARLDAVSVLALEGGVGAQLSAFGKGYVLAFSPRALFSGSSSRGFWAEGVSPLLWVEAPLILLGVGSLVVRARRGVGEAGPARARFLLLWLLLHPIPAALTVPAPNPLRAIGVLPLWALLGAEGARVGLACLQRRGGRGARRGGGWGLACALVLDAGVVGRAY
ncbi:MAG: glycosyltransferase family 39 protein, partial [Planctomycetes bacterium]|nr:glycosyltransferase family 39 protein [Planctomycetota bacterium]